MFSPWWRSSLPRRSCASVQRFPIRAAHLLRTRSLCFDKTDDAPVAPATHLECELHAKKGSPSQILEAEEQFHCWCKQFGERTLKCAVEELLITWAAVTEVWIAKWIVVLVHQLNANKNPKFALEWSQACFRFHLSLSIILLKSQDVLTFDHYYLKAESAFFFFACLSKK